MQPGPREVDGLSGMQVNAKQSSASFGSDTAKDGRVSGDAAADMTCNCLSAKAREKGADVEYAYPNEGFVVQMDGAVLLKDAQNRDNTLKFMNFPLNPKNAGAITNSAAHTAEVAGVEPFLTDGIKSSPANDPTANAPAGQFVAVCEEETHVFYDAIWTKLKERPTPGPAAPSPDFTCP
jgi:spermidine/putrescine transport system substrate-binding protein